MSKLVFPKPQPDKKRYDEILSRGFLKFPKRKENFEKYKLNKNNSNIDYLPIKMDLENVSRCNLKCDMCQVLDFPDNKRADDMSFVDFKKLIDELGDSLIEVKIQGMGEPFLGKDFTEMVHYVSSKDIWTRSSTNASFLHKNENYKRVVDAGIGELQISIDGTTKDAYEKIRVGADFERVSENCKLINSYCDKIELDVTRMWVLLQKDNIGEFFEFPRFAKELGFKRVAIILDVQGFGDKEWIDKNNQKMVSSSITQEMLDRLLENAEKLSINLSFWDISAKFSQQNLCPWPFERAYISSDMKVVPCCMIANPDRFNFGRVTNSFTEIWNSEKYVDFRNAHINSEIPDICKFCYAN